VLLPLLAALPLLLPVKLFDDRRVLWLWSLGSTGLVFLLSLILAMVFKWSGGGFDPGVAGAVTWVEGFGLRLSWGADAISMWLVLLTTFLMPIIMAASANAVGDRAREYYFWLLVLEAAMIGVFVATDVIFFYVCFEFTLIPLYFLIGVFGSSKRLYAARVFFLYTFTGSMLTLAGVIYVAYAFAAVNGAWTFDIAELTAFAARSLSWSEQAWVLAALLCGFAVKVPLFPVHTWLPLAHTEAPTAGSVILAGVLLKLGTYGMLRFAIPMAPDAVIDFAPWIGALAVVGILYAALICWVQKDIKKLIAYSSVSHLGFCVLGLFALDASDLGSVGSVMYMLNHGLSTGALFLCVGMIYERFHTREMAAMSGLAKAMPVWSFFMVVFVLASVGLPGLNGFIGEFMTLLGAFQSEGALGPGFAAVGGIGMVFAAMYLLYMVGKVVWGETKLPHVDPAYAKPSAEPASAGGSPTRHPGVRDLSWREIGLLTPIAIACLVIGLYPAPMLNTLESPVAALTHDARAALGQDTTERPTPPEPPAVATDDHDAADPH